MEKMTYVILLIGLTLNLLVAPALSQQQGLAMTKANGYQIITDMVQAQQLPVEAVILEGWFTIEGRSTSQCQYLMAQLGLEQWTSISDYALTSQSKLNMYYHDNGQMPTLEFQLVTTDLAEGQHYYDLFQPLAKKQPIGVTILSSVDEALEEKTCQYLTIDMTTSVEAELISHIAEGRYHSYALYSKDIQPSIRVAEQAVNINIAYVHTDDETKIYIATPVIYQQY